MPHTISIVIPILNEVNTILKLITQLNKTATARYVIEIILVDGGSNDGTLKLIETYRYSNAIASKHDEHTRPIPLFLIHSEKGRAKQMNVGANKAKGNILYFLHADSFPPKNFDKSIVNEIKKGNFAGCFQMRFDSSHWWLRLAGWLTRFNWRACRGGDQSQFITASLFRSIGGFDERYVIYEDHILINALYQRNTFVVIKDKLVTSSRLYEKKGVWRLQYHFFAIYVKKWLGASPEDLYHYYVTHVKNA